MTRPPSKTRGQPPGHPGSRPEDAPASAEQSPSIGSSLALTVSPHFPAEPYRIIDLPPDVAQRIVVHPESGCWIWTGPVERDGYGKLRSRGVHRVVYVLLVGEIPETKPLLDHVVKLGCISKACCWPAHLEPVTPRTNTLRGTSFAAVNAAKTKCINGHEFDLYTTYYRPNGHRDCRVCIRRRVREYQQRRREPALELRQAA